MESALTHGDGRPFGMPRKAYAVFLDSKQFDDWLKERDSDPALPGGAIGFVCAQVAHGVSLKTLCEHYLIDYGLLWAWISADGAKLQRYYEAQRGVAEYYVSETIAIADDGLNDTYTDDKGNVRVDGDVIQRSKLRIDTRFKVAAKWNRERYGEADAALGAGLENLAAVLTRISERKHRAMREPEIEDAEIVPDKPVLAPVRELL